MSLPSIIIMLIGFGIAMFGMKKQKTGATWGQAVAVVGAVIAMIAAFWNIKGFIGSKGQQMTNERRYMYLQSKFMAEAVKDVAKPKKVVVIVDPMCYLDEYGDKLPQEKENDYMRGVRDAMKGAEIVPVYPTFKNPKPKGGKNDMMMPPMGYTMLNGKDYAAMVAKIKKEKPDCIINIFAFPQDQKLPAALAQLKGFKVGFLNSSSNAELEMVFKDGGKQCAEVLAVTMTKSNNDAAYDGTIPSKDKAAFDRRFVLVKPGSYMDDIKRAQNGK